MQTEQSRVEIFWLHRDPNSSASVFLPAFVQASLPEFLSSLSSFHLYRRIQHQHHLTSVSFLFLSQFLIFLLAANMRRCLGRRVANVLIKRPQFTKVTQDTVHRPLTSLPQTLPESVSYWSSYDSPKFFLSSFIHKSSYRSLQEFRDFV